MPIDMVHVRLNERETNPNPHINFITALPEQDPAAQEDARQLLRALAAQVRPVMKAHGFVVNSFEEYEHNRVFAGRNWNNGEVVELVLRGASGALLPVSWLMSTLCHELAHIQHMNHGAAFQALWAKLRAEVRELQSKGYYGDGYWSSGARLADSARIGGHSLDAGDLPEYICGGAQRRTRPTPRRRRRTQQPAGPSTHTGAQTAKRRKAGTRVTARGAFAGAGAGRALNDDASDEERKREGTGFGRRAGSKRARDERARAAERRLRALQSAAGTSAAADDSGEPSAEDESDGESDTEPVRETDQERRRAVLDAVGQDDLQNLKAAQTDFSADFMFPTASASTVTRLDEPRAGECDVQVLSNPGSSAAAGPSQQAGKKQASLEGWFVPSSSEALPAGPQQEKAKTSVPYGRLIHDEIATRKKESLGLSGPGRKLGGVQRSTSDPASTPAARQQPGSRRTRAPAPNPNERDRRDGMEREWSCLVCTLLNDAGHLACSACTTPRGESAYSPS
ncbi:WLM-domain-containing protein [Wolfiporia cocos MD-104 SS10]|uniref:WLM-domain-containing protein n=1 Tax=Wolfiporia cocos (strain MD-104) TaxID=742152 RepID=A0A2H3JJY2_WOLCO|nr:WLM-domain-containing protein [Wolfiporia cocos MD-104 SS10]